MNVLINTSSGGSVALPSEVVPDDYERAMLLADCFAQAIAAEREACAQVAVRIDSEVHAGIVEPMDAADAIVGAIRERGGA